MAEVRKREKRKEYKVAKNTNKNKQKNTKKEVKPVAKKTTKKEEKKSLWIRFRIFCHGVKSEFKKVHWPSKKDMIKYSIATIVFIIFFALFFRLIQTIFAILLKLV